jgi:integrase
VNEKAYPFGKGKMKYKIPQGGNDPKPLTPEQVNQLMEYVPVNAEVKRWNDRDARNKWEDYARDMWLLSCSVNGVNPKDMCKWDWSNLTKTEKGWQLLWQRSKTIRTLKVPLYGKKILKEDEYKLLMKWANPRSEKYILPVLTQELLESRYDRKANKFVKVMEKDKEQRISALVDNFTHYVNEGLDRICENGGVVGRESIRFYDARDTYANLLKKGGANPFAIQQGLIHKYFSTTEKYLGTLNDDEMQENDQIIEDAMTKAKEARKAKLVKSA